MTDSGIGKPTRGGLLQRTRMAGEHFVAGELNKRGAYATPFAGNIPDIDLVAFSADRGKTAFIQVKTMSPLRSKEWQISIVTERPTRKPGDDSHFTVFVDLGRGNEPPRFWIAPTWWVRLHIYERHRAYLARHGGTRPRTPTSKHGVVKKDGLAEWANRWDILGVCSSG